MIFINPWAFYKKEDLEAINEIITENGAIILPWLILFMNIIIISLWLWICCNDFLFSVALAPTCMLTVFVVIFDIIYILDIWKEKKKHSVN